MFHLPYDACETTQGGQSECFRGAAANEIASFIADFGNLVVAFLT